ncbi:hypothetical protein Q8A67_022838 [Cirrhinus molitorella]|uniref:Uncharacterized protein n=1 Tax=Cirrhinus molitorella TaxID=172907 RepID=A0AA88TBE1_9TELE|nr:hypothetical protein Q8A67_022838 [Cirrhinus molitorella]
MIRLFRPSSWIWPMTALRAFGASQTEFIGHLNVGLIYRTGYNESILCGAEIWVMKNIQPHHQAIYHWNHKLVLENKQQQRNKPITMVENASKAESRQRSGETPMTSSPLARKRLANPGRGQRNYGDGLPATALREGELPGEESPPHPLRPLETGVGV